MTLSQKRALAIALSLGIMASPAHAQAIGGGGGGLLSGVLNWLTGGVITTLASIAIILVGLCMWFLRFHWGTIAAVCVGCWVAFNYQTILGFLQ